MTSPSVIEILPLSAEHRQSAINLIMSSFFTQEPLNSKLKFDLPHEPSAWIEHVFDGALRDQCSFVAIDTSSSQNEVVGVILNGISNHLDQADSFVTQSERLNFVFSLIKKMTNGSDPNRLYQTDRLFHCDILNIDEKQRGQNLSARLINASLKKAHQLGITAAYVICTSLFSRKAFIRHDFEIIKELFYTETGDERLKDMGVHDRCTLLAKQL